MTTGLDPAHLQPWWFYPRQIAVDLQSAGSAWLVLAGMIWLVWQAVAGERTARVLLVWLVLPIVLISLGSSKLGYYALPFLPPLALGGGWLAAAVLSAAHRFAFGDAGRHGAPLRLPLAARTVLVTAGYAGVVVLAWTLATGVFRIRIGSAVIFRNESWLRPLLVAATCLALAGRPLRSVALGAALAAVLFASPLRAYARTFETIDHPRSPLHAVLACVQAGRAAHTIGDRGTFIAADALRTHAYLYYLHTEGPFTFSPDGATIPDEIEARLSVPGRESIVIVPDATWAAWRASHPAFPEPAAIRVEDGYRILLPGPYEACGELAVRAGGERATQSSPQPAPAPRP